MEKLNIRTFGVFSLSAGNHIISDSGNRAGKPWVLMAYLLCHRGTVTSQKKLIDLLWGDSSENRNPENTLRITLHRARALLDGLWPGAGKELILHKDDGYCWNDEAELFVDYEVFEHLCCSVYENEESRLQALQEALLLYHGDFLDKQSAETWVIPMSAYFHNMYISAVMEAAELLSTRGFHMEAAKVCQDAVSAEPYNEALHQLMMQEWAAAGDNKRAVAAYEALSKRLFDDFGIYPGDEIRELYRVCRHSPDENILSAEEVLKNLQEPEYLKGALECDYDYFKILCFAESRAMEREGNATHICLLSVLGTANKPLNKRSVERIMGQLGEQVRLNLRRGDTYSRCSATQYIVMLPKANYENSCMVCRRIVGAFSRAHPGVNVKIQFIVQPLLPLDLNIP